MGKKTLDDGNKWLDWYQKQAFFADTVQSVTKYGFSIEGVLARAFMVGFSAARGEYDHLLKKDSNAKNK